MEVSNILKETKAKIDKLSFKSSISEKKCDFWKVGYLFSNFVCEITVLPGLKWPLFFFI